MIETHAKALLDALEGGEIGSRNPVMVAACFAAQAADTAFPAEAAPMAIARTFLLALIDPLDPELDYLRADPASGEKARAELKGGAA